MNKFDNMQQQLQGSMVALVTPMFADGSVDYPKLADLIEWHINSGTKAIVAMGTTGEPATLSVEEHIDVVRFCVEKVAGRIPLIAGTGANSTSEAINLTRKAKEVGADCALLVAPYYNKPSQEGLYQHYKTIAEAVDIPQILYNVPGRTVISIAQETVERLADIDNIIAIKDATGNLESGEKLIQAVSDKLLVLSGDDPTALGLMKLGGKGNISVTANIVPKEMSEIFDLALQGDFAKAEEIDANIKHLHKDLFVESNPIPTKYALYKMGKIEQGIRLPLVWLDKKYHALVDESLIKANII